MVENAVKDDAHPAGVQFMAEVGKEHTAPLQILHGGDAADILRRVAVMLLPRLHFMIHIIGDDAEMRIDMLIILAVVFMTGRGDKDRIQVQHLNAEILQVIQLIDDALQIAAVETADIRVGGDSIPVGNMLRMTDGIVILIVCHIVGRIPVAETLRKDLILHGALGPGGGTEPRKNAESIDWIEIRNLPVHNTGTDLVIREADAVRTLNDETVDDFLIADDGGFIIIKKRV